MGFGTALPGSLPALLHDLLPEIQRTLPPLEPIVVCDIGAGCGNILSDVEDSGVLLPPAAPNVDADVPTPRPPPRLWGAEMNLAFISQTPLRWRDLIYWCKLEELVETGNELLAETNIAYMYDLCLKRLTRKAKLLKQHAKEQTEKNNKLRSRARQAPASSARTEELELEAAGRGDPHSQIQQVLLSSAAMPALRYFISTYSPVELELGVQEDACREQLSGRGEVDDDKEEDQEGRKEASLPPVTTVAQAGRNTWRLVMQKKLPCSTDSYTFFVYERVWQPTGRGL